MGKEGPGREEGPKEEDGTWENTGAKIRSAPKGPSRAEREEHEALHHEHQPWCRHCVRGRGRNRMHAKVQRTEEEEDQKVPRISMDYHFAGTAQEEGLSKWISMVESRYGAVWSRVVEAKGQGEDEKWVVKEMHEAVSYTHLTLPTILRV